MHDHMMDTSEAPKSVLREGLNGDHVNTTTLETSVPTNPKIVNVTASISHSHNSQTNLVNHVTPVPLPVASAPSTSSSSSSSTCPPTSLVSSLSSVRPLNFSPQIPVTQIQVPRPSQNHTQIPIPNNVFPRMECTVQKPTLVLTQNSIIRNENHIVNHYPIPNNPTQHTIPISLAQPPPILSQQNIIHQNHVLTQNQVSIQGPNFGHQPQPLSVITPVMGTSVIQTVSSSIQTPPVTSGNVSHQQATPVVRPPVISSEANSALRIQPNAIIPLTTHSSKCEFLLLFLSRF